MTIVTLSHNLIFAMFCVSTGSYSTGTSTARCWTSTSSGTSSSGSTARCPGTAPGRVQSSLGPGAYGVPKLTSTGDAVSWGCKGLAHGSAAFRGPDRHCQLNSREGPDTVSSTGIKPVHPHRSTGAGFVQGVCHDHRHSSSGSQCTWLSTEPLRSARGPASEDVSSTMMGWEEPAEGEGRRGHACRLRLGKGANSASVLAARPQPFQTRQAVVQQLAAALQGCGTGASSNRSTSSFNAYKGAAATSDRSSLLLAAAGGCKDAPGPGTYELATIGSIEQHWRREAATGRPSSMFAPPHHSRKGRCVASHHPLSSLPAAVTPRAYHPPSTGQDHHHQQQQQHHHQQTTQTTSASNGFLGGGANGRLGCSSTISSRLPISSPFKSTSAGHELVFTTDGLGGCNGRAPGPQYYRPRVPSAKHSFHVLEQHVEAKSKAG